MRKTAIQTSGAFQRMQTSFVVSDVRLVEVAVLRREAGQPRVRRKARVVLGGRATGQRAGRRRREAGIEVVREVARALVAREVGAVAGDVALPERVAAEQVVEAARRGGEVLAAPGQLVGDREHDEVVSMRPLEPQSQPSAGA